MERKRQYDSGSNVDNDFPGNLSTLMSTQAKRGTTKDVVVNIVAKRTRMPPLVATVAVSPNRVNTPQPDSQSRKRKRSSLCGNDQSSVHGKMSTLMSSSAKRGTTKDVLLFVVSKKFRYPTTMARVNCVDTVDSVDSVDTVDSVDSNEVHTVDTVERVNFLQDFPVKCVVGGREIKERLTAALPTAKNAVKTCVPKSCIGVMPPEVPNFCHAFNTQTSCGLRSKIFKELISDQNPDLRNWTYRQKQNHQRRVASKLQKIGTLPQFDAKAECALDTRFLYRPKSVFGNIVFDARNGTRGRPPGANWWNLCLPASCLHTIDSINGAQLVIPTCDDEDNFVFRLLPRKQAIGATSNNVTTSMLERASLKNNTIVRSLQTVEEKNKTNGTPRGKRKDVLFACPGSCFHRVGKFAHRNKKGIDECFLGDVVLPGEDASLGTFIRKCEKEMCEYLHPGTISGAKMAMEIVGSAGMHADKGRRCDLFTSVAFGKDVYLSCHKDEDSLCSMVTLLQEVPHGQPYSLDDPIVYYFCFPEYGVKVALRAGDKLIFNPQVFHCLSSPMKPCDGVYTMSLYTKTAVIGGNDNSKPLTYTEKMNLK